MKNKRNVLFVLLLLLVSVILAGQQNWVYARGGGDVKYGEKTIQKGWVYRVVGSNAVIIDDMTFQLSSTTSFFDSKNKPTGLYALSQGVFVGFLHNNGLITEVHVLSTDDSSYRPGSQPAVQEVPGKNDDIILENGIWKN